MITASPARKLFRPSIASVFLFCCGAAMLIASFFRLQTTDSPSASPLPPPPETPVYASASIIRLNESKLTRPVLYVNGEAATPAVLELKKNIETIIEKHKTAGTLKSASVYFRKMDEAGSMTVNNKDAYDPGSMMKVPIMMAHLRKIKKQEELNRKLFFPGRDPQMLTENGAEQRMEPGQYYTIKHLIELMIVESDNDAVVMLMGDLEPGSLEKIYNDLNITQKKNDESPILLTVNEYARFFSVLYDASYLGRQQSEWALELLCGSSYHKSLTRSIPGQLTVAHKYGVAQFNSNLYLGEAGIFYSKDSPYLIVIMTNGMNESRQSDVIDEISGMIFRSAEQSAI